ncbi:hypothetical protein PB1_14419 [Bacillus methanolicus PB1]|uniref:Lipoprotein n=1 Tax=Bacillus methanolicus PB1 TaxID=997296 RepID=I3DWY9_BACMT|nr:hypothetical protein [Bacillus methanolicus]EIJ78760.1 hypothetical protein PB1_14419 [Bacillus methanolicus PB1]
MDIKKWIVNFLVFSFFTLLLIGCRSDLKQLTRVDVQEVKSDGSYSQAVMITDKDTVNMLNKIFEKIEWEQYVEAKMSRKEDVKAILFFEIDENMLEKLVEYLIWFNQENGTATIISSDETENFGILDKDHAKELKKVLFNSIKEHGIGS